MSLVVMHDNVTCDMCNILDKTLQRVGDPQQYNCKIAGLVTSSKFTYLENLYISYTILRQCNKLYSQCSPIYCNLLDLKTRVENCSY